MSKRVLSLVAVLALAGAAPAAAQTWQCAGVATCSATQTASLTIPALVSLNLGAATFTLTPPTTTDLGVGVLETTNPAITVKANRSWTLQLSATGPNFTYAGSEAGVKPMGDLKWKKDVIGAALTDYAAITNVATTINTGNRTNGASPLLFFATDYPAAFDDARNRPGTYTLDMTFTLSAP